jgi:hypothetical protein
MCGIVVYERGRESEGQRGRDRERERERESVCVDWLQFYLKSEFMDSQVEVP